MTKEQQGWLNEKLSSFDCIFVGFHGSFLYGLEREGSDIDVKAVYLPTKTDLILGDSAKTHNFKNDELDIEVEVKSLSSFLKSAKACDTNCVDLLHCPEEMIITKQPLWDEIVKHKSCIFAKNMRGIVGYIKTHAKKYTNKIDRFNEMKKVLEVCDTVSSQVEGCKVMDVAEYVGGEEYNFKYVKPVTLVQDHEQQYLEVCGKKYIFTWDVSQLSAAMEHEISRYGNRTNDGSEKGMDTKSLSHALRVLFELKEILSTKTVTFPLKEKDYVLAVKLNKVPYDEVMSKIDSMYDECMELLATSELPEYNDLSPMYAAVEKYYFGG